MPPDEVIAEAVALYEEWYPAQRLCEETHERNFWLLGYLAAAHVHARSRSGADIEELAPELGLILEAAFQMGVAHAETLTPAP